MKILVKDIKDAMEEIRKLKEEPPIDSGKWIVVSKGGPYRQSFEIAVVRETNKHGIQSYGWFDPRYKRLISHSGGPCNWSIDDQDTWDALVRVAELTADRLNKMEEWGA